MSTLFGVNFALILTFFLSAAVVIESVRVNHRPRIRMCAVVSVPNAEVLFKHNNKVMKITCYTGFKLEGSNIAACENGKWNAVLPVCSKEGCPKPDTPENGIIMPSRVKTKADLYCYENFKLVGSRVSYCNGTHWDRPLGKCEETNDKTQLACDFESDDLCGWSHDQTHNFDWKRVMAVNFFTNLRTGPQHDHTTFTANSGHYMLMESFDQQPNNVARLISPIYSKNLTNVYACFRFYYFMYGAAVGSLNVYVKPETVDIEIAVKDTTYKYFGISGNQKMIWKEGLFIIKQLTDNFQIIIEGTAGINHLSDIAIDDVEIMGYSKCASLTSNGATRRPELNDLAIFDAQSCEGRCSETSSSNFGITNNDGVYYKTCDCHAECEDSNTCCPNYRSICEFANSDTTTEALDSATNLSSAVLNMSTTTSTLITTNANIPIKLYSSLTTITNPVKTKTSTTSSASRTTTSKTMKTSNNDIIDEDIYEARGETVTSIMSSVSSKSSSEIPDPKKDVRIYGNMNIENSTPTMFNITPAMKTHSSGGADEMHSIDGKPSLHTITPFMTPKMTNHRLRKEKQITWYVNENNKFRKNENDLPSGIFNMAIAAVTLLCLGLAFKHNNLLQHIKKYLLKNEKEDTTVLIYNNEDETI